MQDNDTIFRQGGFKCNKLMCIEAQRIIITMWFILSTYPFLYSTCFTLSTKVRRQHIRINHPYTPRQFWTLNGVNMHERVCVT